VSISAGDEASNPELVAALEPIVGARITHVERRRSPYRSSHPLELLTIRTIHGRRTELVFKDLSPAVLDGAARAAKAEALGPSWRELDVYRDVLSGAADGVPARRGEHRIERDGRYWLFLEPIVGAELYTVGEFHVWVAALESVARLHETLDLAPRPASLARYDEHFFARWPDRAVEFAVANDRALLRRIAGRYAGVLDRLRQLPVAIVHGDLYPANVMIRSGEARRNQVVVLDWESAGIGPPLLDVATLTAGSWTGVQRDRLALAYRGAMPVTARPDLAQFLVDLDCCRLHVALQWLGWSQTWTPPPEHRHDWTSEARAAAERLELL
jgi:hypothetical protein